MSERRLTWCEFFAGGGMARLGLGARWECIFANEWCEKKAAAYRAYFGPGDELKVTDVAKLKIDDIPGIPDLVWASFPCQDLSLAGSGAGLLRFAKYRDNNGCSGDLWPPSFRRSESAATERTRHCILRASVDGKRSGTFRPFWRLLDRTVRDGRGPKLIVVENVVGTITSHAGNDFTAIVHAFSRSGYRVGAVVIDAVRFLPHSRPRWRPQGTMPVPPAWKEEQVEGFFHRDE